MADNVLSIKNLIELLTVLTTITLTLVKRIKVSIVVSTLAKDPHIIFSHFILGEDELDVLTQIEIDIRAFRPEDRLPLYLIQNRSIDNLDQSFAYTYTCFTKEKLCKIFSHVRHQTTVNITRRNYKFTGEDIMIVSLARITTGDAWHCLIPLNFGDGTSRCSEALLWFINYVFIHFYHKISRKILRCGLDRWVILEDICIKR